MGLKMEIGDPFTRNVCADSGRIVRLWRRQGEGDGFWFKTKQNRPGLDMGCEGRQASIFQGLGFLGGREKHGSVTEVESSGGARIFLVGRRVTPTFPLGRDKFQCEIIRGNWGLYFTSTVRAGDRNLSGPCLCDVYGHRTLG